MTQTGERSNVIFNLVIDAISQFQLCQSFISIGSCMNYGHRFHFVLNKNGLFFYEWKCFLSHYRSYVMVVKYTTFTHPHTHSFL